MFTTIAAAREMPTAFAHLERRYNIQAALFEYPSIPPGTGEALSRGLDLPWLPPGWALVYWDDVCYVMLKETGPNAALVARDALRALDPIGDHYNWISPRFSDETKRRAILVDAERAARAAAPDDLRPTLLVAKLAFHGGDLVRAEALARGVRGRVSRWLHHQADARLVAALLLAEIAERRGRGAEAIALYREVLQLSPLRRGALYRLGVLLEAAGETGEAIAYYRRALALYPGMGDAARRLGRLLRARGDLAGAALVDKAAAHAEQYVSGETNFYQGTRLYQAGHLEQAAEAFRASVKVNPASAAALSNLGYALYDLHKNDEALTYQLRAVEVDPGFANAHYGLGLIYMKRGDRERARHHFKRFLGIIPRGHFSRKAEQLLEQLR
jgi:tetratricopeptide (TPR) repeat protein